MLTNRSNVAPIRPEQSGEAVPWAGVSEPTAAWRDLGLPLSAVSALSHEGELPGARERAAGQPAALNRGSLRLRVTLVGLDVIALGAAWVPRLLGFDVTSSRSGGSFTTTALATLVTVVATIAFLCWERLYLARVCMVKAVELTRLWRAVLFSSVAGAFLLDQLGGQPSLRGVVVRGLLTFGLLAGFRSLYRGWLKGARQKGRFTRPILIVGTNEDALAWHRLLANHPELGMRVSGFVGSRTKDIAEAGVPWLGPSDRTVLAAQITGATGAIIAASALAPSELNQVSRELLRAGLHVQISNGLWGIDCRRVSSTSLAYESVLYLERWSLKRWQVVVKRCLDIAGALVLLTLAAPVLAVAALAVKLGDGGPVLFRQSRVGRNGDVFTLLKLRTMVVNAEERQSELVDHNERRGPLFKLTRDPRVTRVGRILRPTSVDELPQLINVLKGEMSLVGPRPALPCEVASFDPELLARHDVLPGITGLWQLEARDNPSFEVYQRLDLHYVENWSVFLDVTILCSTAAHVVGRTVRTLWGVVRGSPHDRRVDSAAVALVD